MSKANSKIDGYYYGGRYRKSSIALVPALALLFEDILVVHDPRFISSKRIN